MAKWFELSEHKRRGRINGVGRGNLGPALVNVFVLSGQCDGRRQTKGKMQIEGKMRTVDYTLLCIFHKYLPRSDQY